MSTISTIMVVVFIAGVLSFFVSLASLIADRRRKKENLREQRRQHITENTVRTMLRFPASQKPYSLRKSS